jgi:hypothetical protein
VTCPRPTLALGQDADFDDADPARAEADFARLAEEIRLADEAAASRAFDDTFTLGGEQYSLRLVYVRRVRPAQRACRPAARAH